MNKEKYIDSILKKSKVWKGRRWYKEKPFSHFVWNFYHPDNPWKKGEVIHHKNEDTLDDDINNLEKMTKGNHNIIHKTGSKNPMWGRISSKNPNYGKKHSEKTKKKISKTMKGRKLLEETKKKISEARKGRKSPMCGKKHTKETKEKMSEVKIGSKNPMYDKKHTKETKRKISITKLKRRGKNAELN